MGLRGKLRGAVEEVELLALSGSFALAFSLPP